MLCYGCFDFGRVASTHAILCNATRRGADYAATHRFEDDARPGWEAAVRAAAAEEMSGFNAYSNTALTVTTTDVTDADGVRRVTVRCEYQFDTLVAWLGLPARIPLRHTIVCRQIH
ncbi:MAG: hypothetical protein QM811_21525 [Pirellulales bacterium]